jgi:hypothetical protein
MFDLILVPVGELPTDQTGGCQGKEENAKHTSQVARVS